MNAEWILIADASSARIFHRGASPLTLIPVSELDDTSPPDADESARFRRFAKCIARRLEEDLADGRFDSLIVVAPDPLPGVLKAELSAAVEHCIALEMNDDFSRVGIAEMGRRVMKAEAAAALRCH